MEKMNGVLECFSAVDLKRFDPWGRWVDGSNSVLRALIMHGKLEWITSRELLGIKM